MAVTKAMHQYAESGCAIGHVIAVSKLLGSAGRGVFVSAEIVEKHVAQCALAS